MKQVSEFCPMKMVPFEYEVEVPNNLEKEKILLHVRVMDGRSVNSLYLNRGAEFDKMEGLLRPSFFYKL